MSTFSIFQKMNQKLEQGWKLTTANCPICNTTIIGRLDTKEMFCVKCDMPVKMEMEPQDDDQVQDDVEVIGSGSKGSPEPEEDFDNMVVARQREMKRQKSDETSKKMGEKLLQGWAMLEDVCEECLFPYMKSRQGEIICVGCGPIKDKKQKAEEQKISEFKPTTPETKTTKQEPKKEEKPVTSKTAEAPKVDTKTEVASEKVDKKEKKEKKDAKRKEHKKEKHHKKPMKTMSSESRNTEDIQALLELGTFDESLSLYSKMTSLLHDELDKLSESGLMENSDKVWEILSLQKKIDKSKIKIVKKLAK